MAETADVLIAGAGISGLVDAILLAETGRRVLVCEQHRVPGGYLQQFRRKKTTFDVGFHYMGSTEPGRPMRVFLEYLDLWRRLELVPLPDECAIEVCRGERRFGYPGRFDRFIEKAHETWPHERDAIDRFVDECRATCREYKWFHLDPGLEYSHPLELDHGDRTFADYMDERIEDPWLREVLSFMTFSIGLYAHEIPWSKHLLAFRSNFDRT
ncbi:MAG: NAD(P)-binding protein, partial [Planctomycetes bacterium]|nr:NAD(P)-binding protein [Planctomycetota bacterium]